MVTPLPSVSVLNVPLGRSCNNRCIVCNERSQGTPARLSLQEIEEQLEHMRDQTTTVVFSAGEPTLNTILAQSAAAARDRGYQVIGLVTKGRRLQDADLCARLLDAGLNDIKVSLAGPSAEVHEAITRRRGSFEQTVQGLKNLAALRQHHSFGFTATCTLVKPNFLLLREIHDFAQGLGVDCMGFNVVEPCGAAADDFDLSMPRYRDVMEVVDGCGLDFRDPVRSVARVPVCAGGLEWVQETFLFALDKKVTRYDPAAGKIQGPPCAECSLRSSCPGIWELYVEHYGWEEFSPVIPTSRHAGETLRVFTSSLCNNNCIHCLRPPSLPPVARQLRDGILAGFRRIELAGGELLLNDRAAGLVNLDRDLGYQDIVIGTNARVLCLPRYLEQLLQLQPSEVVVRMNAGEADVHDSMARVPGAFEQTLCGLELLRQNAIPFSVRLRRHPQNQTTVEAARRLAMQAGARKFEVLEDPPGN